MMTKLPKIIEFEKIGNPSEGYISISQEKNNIDFKTRRVFWTYKTPPNVSRGRHAHYETEMILIAVQGEIEITTENNGGEKASFKLSDPNMGLYLPKLCWHEMFYSEDAVQLVLCSTEYDEGDYIRSKEKFDQLAKESNND